MNANTKCDGQGILKFTKAEANTEDCAKACEGVSSMFAFCSGQACHCEQSATVEGSCKTKYASGCMLYKYTKRGALKFTKKN